MSDHQIEATLSRASLEALKKSDLVDLVLRLQASEAPQNPPRGSIKRKREEIEEIAENGAKSNPGRLTKKQRKGKIREMDWSKWSLRHVAFKFAYLGFKYRGLAQQSPSDDTIEGKLFDALKLTRLVPEDATWSTVNYTRCGRTDKGVSAFGQVIAIHVRSKVTSGLGLVKEGNVKKDASAAENEELDYVGMLNRVLPSDIRLLAWSPVSLDFSARFSTVKRMYKYLFIRGDLDLVKMREAAAYFKGDHDFRNFCKIDVAKVKHFRRIVFDIQIVALDDSAFGSEATESALFAIVVQGTAFLWHQIRCMVAILFLVGQNLESPQIVADLLDIEKNNRKPVYEMASEVPLILYSAEHTGVKWIYPVDGLGYAKKDIVEGWEDSHIKAAVHWAMLQGLETKPSQLDRKSARYTHLLDRERESTSSSFSAPNDMTHHWV